MNAAIGSMKSITEGSDPRPGDVFRLAQMYRKTGQSEAFVKSLGSLAEKDPSNPSYVTAYLNALLDENRLEEAQPWAARLQRDHAGEFPSLQVLVKYHHLNNEPTRAMELAERYFRAVEAGSNEAPQRLRRIGELFDEVSKLGGPQRNRSRAMLADAAIRHYEACLSGQPDAAILLASLLARMDRAEEGFTQLVRIGSRISDRARIAGGLDLLRSGRATPHHQTEIRRWVDEALSRRPNSMALRLSLGEYFTLINDFTEAEKAFRAALELDPDNVVALNNLAWVMAPDQTRAAQALEHIEKALQISGRNSELLDTRARALLTRGAEGDYDRAVADLTEALGEGQTSLRYFHLAVAKLKQSDTNEAVDAFRKAEAHGLEKRMVHPADMPAYQTLRSRLGT